MVGDAWLSNKLMHTSTDDPPVKLDLSFNDLIFILSKISPVSQSQGVVTASQNIDYIEARIILFLFNIFSSKKY